MYIYKYMYTYKIPLIELSLSMGGFHDSTTELSPFSMAPQH